MFTEDQGLPRVVGGREDRDEAPSPQRDASRGTLQWRGHCLHVASCEGRVFSEICLPGSNQKEMGHHLGIVECKFFKNNLGSSIGFGYFLRIVIS